jgi:hypothetical protein
MVDLNIVNAITIALIAIAALMLVRIASKAVGKSSPV